MSRVVDDDSESPYRIGPDIFDFFYKVVSVFVALPKHHMKTTMLLDVCRHIWAPPECNTTSSVSLYDVTCRGSPGRGSGIC